METIHTTAKSNYLPACEHELYAELIKSKLCGTFGDVACNTDVEVPELNEDEENIIRYAAGYIPFKLLKKDEKNDMIECLSNMSVQGDESSIQESGLSK